MRDATARQLDAFIEPPPRNPAVIRVPDLRIEAPRAPGSKSSERAAEAVEKSPFRSTSYRRILLTLGSLSEGQVLSREEICARTGIRESSMCARLSELSLHWIEVVEDACVSSAGMRVKGYRLTSAGRGLFEERRTLEDRILEENNASR